MKKTLYTLSICFLLLIANRVLAQTQTALIVKDLGKIDETIKNQLNEVLLAYYNLKNALVASHATDAQEMTGYVLSSLNQVDTKKMTKEQVEFFKKHIDLLKLDLHGIAKTTDIEAQRAYFHGISANMKQLIATFKANKQKTYEQRCPMAFDNKGASWLSAESEIKNPYYGSRMMKCGSVISEF